MKKFTKTVEDFTCENCGYEVKGNGFTNHCPKCFYSKHVDNNPGDRDCSCGGLMEPVSVLQKNGDFVILHRCKKCGFERKNKVTDENDFNGLIMLSKKLAQHQIIDAKINNFDL
ncbi:MAG: RNHCP domain-containing protein [Rickettsiales bacterium]|nr:RNHCP domain-containing protein [Rickettsiales bacterium]